MKVKKYIWLALSLVLLCGCTDVTGTPPPADVETSAGAKQPQTVGEQGPETLSFVYFDGDSLNPLNCQGSTNFSMKFLFCDPIIALNEVQQPMEALATSWELKGNKAVLNLREGVTFHDGSRFGAADVVNTLNYVISEPTSFYYSLGNDILSVKATGSLTVEITLKEADFGIFSRLNIPVVKVPSATDFPIGTGKYYLQQEKKQIRLEVYEKWYGTSRPTIKTIEFHSYPDRQAINFAFSTGEINLINKGVTQEGQEGYYGNSEEFYYTSQNLVFLSVNTKNVKLTAPVRSCFNLLIDRYKLTGGRTQAVITPLYPQWWALSQNLEEPVYITRTQREEQLKQLGFVDLDGNGMFDKADGTPIEPFILLANGDNIEKSEIALKIADQLRIMGFPVTIATPDFAGYQMRLQEGNFDFALVEVALNSSMDISPLVSEGGINNYGSFIGIKTGSALAQLKVAKSEGEYRQAGDLLQAALLEETPVIPLFYRKGTMSVQGDIQYQISPTSSDIFANIEKWSK